MEILKKVKEKWPRSGKTEILWAQNLCTQLFQCSNSLKNIGLYNWITVFQGTWTGIFFDSTLSYILQKAWKFYILVEKQYHIQVP